MGVPVPCIVNTITKQKHWGKFSQLDDLPNANQQSDNIGNSVFYHDTTTSLQPTKDEPQGIREVCKSETSSPR